MFFVIDVSLHRVQIAGSRADPCEKQMLQWARTLTDAENGFLKGKRILIHDRGPLFTKGFQETLRASGVRCPKIPRWSPNLNSFSESWIRGVKRDCFDKIVFFGEKQIRYVAGQYVKHFLTERPHTGLEYRRPIEPILPHHETVLSSAVNA